MISSEYRLKCGPRPAAAKSPVSRNVSRPVLGSAVTMTTSSAHRRIRSARVSSTPFVSRCRKGIEKGILAVVHKHDFTLRTEHIPVITALEPRLEGQKDSFCMLSDDLAYKSLHVEIVRVLYTCQSNSSGTLDASNVGHLPQQTRFHRHACPQVI